MMKIKTVVLVFNPTSERQMACPISLKAVGSPEGDAQWRGDRKGFLGLYGHSACSAYSRY